MRLFGFGKKDEGQKSKEELLKILYRIETVISSAESLTSAKSFSNTIQEILAHSLNEVSKYEKDPAVAEVVVRIKTFIDNASLNPSLKDGFNIEEYVHKRLQELTILKKEIE